MELDGCWVPLREQHTGRGAGNPGHSLQLSGSWSRNPNMEHWSEGFCSRNLTNKSLCYSREKVLSDWKICFAYQKMAKKN